MPLTGSDIRRHILGTLALLLLLTAAYGWIAHRSAENETHRFIFSSCQRIGLVLGAAWLAYPQLARIASRASARFVVPLVLIGLILGSV